MHDYGSTARTAAAMNNTDNLVEKKKKEKEDNDQEEDICEVVSPGSLRCLATAGCLCGLANVTFFVLTIVNFALLASDPDGIEDRVAGLEKDLGEIKVGLGALADDLRGLRNLTEQLEARHNRDKEDLKRFGNVLCSVFYNKRAMLCRFREVMVRRMEGAEAKLEVIAAEATTCRSVPCPSKSFANAPAPSPLVATLAFSAIVQICIVVITSF